MPSDSSLQAVRGLACVLLVLYHVVGSNPANGLRIAEGDLRVANDALAILRMPLFAFLAGCVFALRRTRSPVIRFVSDKALRLLVPMLVVGTAFAGLQAWIPGTNQSVRDWSMLHIEPVGHLWFPLALFWILVLASLLERARWLNTPSRLLLVWAIAAALYLLMRGSRLLAMDGAIYLLPFFLCGFGAQRFKLFTAGAKTLPAVLLALTAVVSMLAIGVPEPDGERRTLPMLMGGMSMSALLVLVCPRSRLLSWLGEHAYTIFLFHVFFTAGVRLVLSAIGVDSLLTLCLAGVAAGIVGPMLVHRWATRAAWSRLLLLGERPRATGRRQEAGLSA